MKKFISILLMIVMSLSPVIPAIATAQVMSEKVIPLSGTEPVTGQQSQKKPSPLLDLLKRGTQESSESSEARTVTNQTYSRTVTNQTYGMNPPSVTVSTYGPAVTPRDQVLAFQNDFTSETQQIMAYFYPLFYELLTDKQQQEMMDWDTDSVNQRIGELY